MLLLSGERLRASTQDPATGRVVRPIERLWPGFGPASAAPDR